MGKKNGSALVLMLAVITLLIVLSVSVLTVSTSAFKSNIAYDRINQVRLLAESGVEQALGHIKNGNDIAVPVNAATSAITNLPIIASVDNLMQCSIKVTATIPSTGNYNYTIVSSASGAGYSKTITVVYKKVNNPGGGSGGGTSSQVTDLVNNYLLKKSLTITTGGSIDNVFTWPDASGNSATNLITITGDMFLQGNNVNITPTEYHITGNITYNGNSFAMEQTKNNDKWGTFDGTVTQVTDAPAVIQPNSTAPIDINPRLYLDGDRKIIVFNTNKDIPDLGAIDDYIAGNFPLEYQDPKIFKIIICKGNIAITPGAYNRYIIYATGMVDLLDNGNNNNGDAVNLTNSTICANAGVTFVNKVDLDIENQAFNTAVSEAADIINNYLDNILAETSYEGIANWQE